MLQFEKDNIEKFESKIYRLKKIFNKRYKHYFLYGDLTRRSYEKPFGYAGDFKVIDDIYRNQPATVGFDGLWDRYFLQMTASKATRQRKEELKKIIFNIVKDCSYRNIRIMNLGSGSAREIKELLANDSEGLFSKVTFDCYDFDIRAINYAQQLLNNVSNVNFFQKNAVRLALKKDITHEVRYDYDLIYSSGLFDYLDERVAVRLIANLRKLLKREGKMVIANFGNKYNNSSAGLMEWATEWYLIYRDEDNFTKIFIDAGFSPTDFRIISQKDNVVLHCVTSGE